MLFVYILTKFISGGILKKGEIVPLLNNKEIKVALNKLTSWQLSGHEIKKTYECKNFKTALQFVNIVGELAEQADHHPDILVHSWNKVTLTISTHNEGGLTLKDFDLASEIEKFYQKF